MIRSPWQAAAMLLALSACAAPPAQTPTETPAAPQPATVEAAPEEPAAPEAVVIETAVAEPEAPEPEIAPETQAIIDNALAALSPPETVPEPAPAPAPAPPVIEAAPETAPEPEIDDDPEQLMGLAGGALAALLGEPGFLREDADAQVWQYRGSDCMLDVYLYRGGEDAPHQVTYYEFRGAEIKDAGRPCLRGLLLSRTAG